MAHWPEKRFDYDGSGNITYIGRNSTLGASTGSTDWHIFKYTYTDNSIVRIQGAIIAAWDDRATQDW